MSTWQKLGTCVSLFVSVTVTVSVTCLCWSLANAEQKCVFVITLKTRILRTRIITFWDLRCANYLKFWSARINRGRELLLNLFSENTRIIRNSGLRELIETTSANYLNFGDTWRKCDINFISLKLWICLTTLSSAEESSTITWYNLPPCAGPLSNV